MMLRRISAARVSAIATAMRSILMRLEVDSGLAILLSLPVDCVVGESAQQKKNRAFSFWLFARVPMFCLSDDVWLRGGRVRRNNSNRCPYNKGNRCWPRCSSIPLFLKIMGSCI